MEGYTFKTKLTSFKKVVLVPKSVKGCRIEFKLLREKIQVRAQNTTWNNFSKKKVMAFLFTYEKFTYEKLIYVLFYCFGEINMNK